MGVRHSFEHIKSVVELNGYSLDPSYSSYKNAFEKFKLKCPKGHEFQSFWNNFQGGSRCPDCAGVRTSHSKVEAYLARFNYTLQSQYKNCKTLMEVSCPKGHEYKVQWNNFREGKRCPHCAGRIVTELHVKTAIESEGYALRSKWERSDLKMDFECNFGHTYKSTWNGFRAGNRCPVCSPGGFNPGLPGAVYYIRFDFEGKRFYKVGITNKTLEQRFSHERLPFVVLSENRYLFGYLAFEEEQRILKKYARFRYKGEHFLDSGNCELFVKDVLRLDKS
jgi:hypothetical protein